VRAILRSAVERINRFLSVVALSYSAIRLYRLTSQGFGHTEMAHPGRLIYIAVSLQIFEVMPSFPGFPLPVMGSAVSAPRSSAPFMAYWRTVN
jgi:hypothetical protein